MESTRILHHWGADDVWRRKCAEWLSTHYSSEMHKSRLLKKCIIHLSLIFGSSVKIMWMETALFKKQNKSIIKLCICQHDKQFTWRLTEYFIIWFIILALKYCWRIWCYSSGIVIKSQHTLPWYGRYLYFYNNWNSVWTIFKFALNL